LQNGKIFITTTCFYNRVTEELKKYSHDNDKPNSFGAHGSGEIMTDKDNNVWISATRGLELLEPSKQFFQHHWLGEKKDREDYYGFGLPQPVQKYGNNYWAGLWYGKGLIKMDSNWNIIKHYKSIPENSALVADAGIYGIYKDNSNIFWISTDHCLTRFDESKNSFASFVPSDAHPSMFEFRGVKKLGENKLLVRTRHNGFYIFNTGSRQFEKHICISTTTNFPSDDANDLLYDKKGTLWVTTSEGLCSMDTINFTVLQVFKAAKPGSNSLVNNGCISMAVDAQNNLWITTLAGLSKLNIEKRIFTNYTKADGLPNNSVSKIIIDKNNNLWMITGNGLSLFQSSTNTFHNFYQEDGLPENSLEGTINKDENGILYFGDAGIVLTVNPDDIPFNKTKPAVIITDALLDGKHYTVQKNHKNENLLQTISGNSSFAVNFAVLNFNSPKHNRYYYKLEGIDNNWHESDRGVASYINVPPGNYILKVKGSNNSGLMNEEGDFIRIIVVPKWYQTWWFKMLAVLFMGFVILYFVKRRIKNIRKESELKQQITETKMQALRAQMNPHFIFNSLNSIENFIMQNNKRLASDYLNKFARLIRMILDSSRNEIVPLSKDMEALQLYIDLEQLRFNNKFSCSMYIDPALLNGDYSVPSLIIQPYVENAIVHGLAHSEKTNLALSVTAALEGSNIKYTITDNGVGRKQAAEYNSQNKPHHKSVGLDITEARLKNFNNNNSDINKVKITDLYESGDKPAGTKVEITFNVM
jgi:sugar lactone lactonase YvrE